MDAFSPKAPQLVPEGYAKRYGLTAADVGHLRWMMQKDRAGQDMYLLSLGGPQRRRLALAYAELVRREVEIVTLTRDTTEADLKQRRELVNGTAVYVDQAPVRAAVHGRLLVLEGVERAERNVLPLLNNLLENREMALEDGRFLVSPDRWRLLCSERRPGESDEAIEARLRLAGLVPVHPSFRVIALGMPSPPLPGRPLDPPLRSRFSARRVIDDIPFREESPAAPIAGFSRALLELALPQQSSTTPTSSSNLLPAAFPASTWPSIEQHLVMFPNDAAYLADVLHMNFPFHLFPSFRPMAAAESNRGSAGSHADPRASQSSFNGLSPPIRHLMETCKLASIHDALLSKDVAGVTAYYHAGVGAVSSRAASGGHKVQLLFEPRAVAVSASASTSPTTPSIPGHALSSTEAVACEAAGGPEVAAADARAATAEVYLTEPLERTLSGILKSHALGRHACIVGPPGCGKSALARELSHRLGYNARVFPLYTDMTARELFQRRATTSSGDSVWVDSPLIDAAVRGEMCILDGVDRLPGDTLASLSSLILDGAVQLPDGALLRAAFDPSSPVPEGVRLIHPSFRVVALCTTEDFASWAAAAPKSADMVLHRTAGHRNVRSQATGRASKSAPSGAGMQKPLSVLHPDVFPMFHFHCMPLHSASEEARILRARVPAAPPDALLALTRFAHSLTHAAEQEAAVDAHAAAAMRLSMRHMLRFARLMALPRTTAHTSNDKAPLPADVLDRIMREIQDALFFPILPQPAQEMITAALRTHGFLPTAADTPASTVAPTREITLRSTDRGETELQIGEVKATVSKPAHPELVPLTKFFDIPQHVARLEDMLADYVSGEHALLLIGNQGTGKNKLVDRLLQLLRKEREYMQLHRDTTVASLTLAPTVRDGRIFWEDSPLVKAAKYGRALVVDELDKAPPEVVAVLKSLIEDGDMLLADGRRLLRHSRLPGMGAAVDPAVVPIHSDFKVFCLANRPGWPFLGNNVFTRGLAACFASHWIENPDVASELALVKSYAPDVAEPLLRALVLSFAELRDLHSKGTVAYPYSTREIVAIAKHLQLFPQDGAARALTNVVAFDAFDPQALRTVERAFAKQGLLGLAPALDGTNAPHVDVALAEPQPAAGDSTTVVRVLAPAVLSPRTQSPAGVLPTGPGRRGFATVTTRVAAGEPMSLRSRVWTPDDDFLSRPIAEFPVHSPRADMFAEEKAAWRLLPSHARRGTNDDDAPAVADAASVRTNGKKRTEALAVLTSKPDTVHMCIDVADPGGLHPTPVLSVSGVPSSRSYRQLRLGLAAQVPATMGGLLPPTSWQRAGRSATSSLRSAVASFGVLHRNADEKQLPTDPALLALHGMSAFAVAVPSASALVLVNPGELASMRVLELPVHALDMAPTATPAHGLPVVQQVVNVYEKNAPWLSAPAPPAKRVETQVHRQYDNAFGSCRLAQHAESDSALLWRLGSRSLIVLRQLLSDASAHVLHMPAEIVSSGGIVAARAVGGSELVLATSSGVTFVLNEATGELRALPSLPPSSAPSILPAASSTCFASQNSSQAGALPLGFQVPLPTNVAWPSTTPFVTQDGLILLTTRDATAGVILHAASHTSRAVRRIPLGTAESPAPRALAPPRMPILCESAVGPDQAPPETFVVHADGRVQLLQLRLPRLQAELEVWRAVQGGTGEDDNRYADLRIRLETDSSAEAAELRKRLLGRDGRAAASAAELLEIADRKAKQEKDAADAAGGRPEAGAPPRAPPQVDQPKHGKEDPKNEPHVGGGMWAGGTGGSNTAGLGGRGGPYRLDKGHRVHQVSDAAKAEVPEHVRREARRMAQEALAARLDSIGMQPADAARYASMRAQVAGDIALLRNVLASAEQSSDERIWQKHQAYGDLDDAKLVDGLTGDRMIFKRRAAPDDPAGLGVQKPALMHFVFDASASMYRFNGLDGRLERSMEVATLVMEAFSGFEHRYRYRMSLHSGDSPHSPLVQPTAPPSTELERLKVVDTILAHSQFCSSGDYTLAAAEHALLDMKQQTEVADKGKFVFLLSDANFQRYGIRPDDMARVFASAPDVHSALILLCGGVDEDEGDYIVRAMPPHTAFVVRNTTELPALFKRFLTAAFAARF